MKNQELVTYNLLEFLSKVEGGKIIAIDPGRKSIGIAVSSVSRRCIENYFQFPSRGRSCDAWYISKIEDNYSGIIMGTPFSHTRNNNWISFIDNFVTKLSEVVKKPILMWDESSSTEKIQDLIRNVSWKRKKNWRDKLSAYCILSEVLYTIRDQVWRPMGEQTSVAVCRPGRCGCSDLMSCTTRCVVCGISNVDLDNAQ